MESIIRSNMLYKTGVEYGDYAMNHVLGCSHVCKYPCVAFMQKKRFRNSKSNFSYNQWCKPQLVANTLELLEDEIPKFKKKIQSVMLCPCTDPFMYGNKKVAAMSLSAMRRLNLSGIKCIVLTKGILPELLTSLPPINDYGITLVSLNEDYRQLMEPGAAPISDRLQALKNLHDKNLNTWVSIEPYPTPNLIEQDLDELLEAVSFVDKIVFGTNYSKDVTSFKQHKKFYNDCTKQVIKFCMNHGIDCHIKKGTFTNF